MKPTALDDVLDRVAVGDSQLHTKAVIDPLVAAARREVEILRELAEAYIAEMDNPADDRPIGSGVRLLDARIAYLHWQVEQEK